MSPKVHCLIHESISLSFNLSRKNLVHPIPSYVSRIHFNIILQRMSQIFLLVSSLLDFPSKLFMYSCSLLCVLHALPIASYLAS